MAMEGNILRGLDYVGKWDVIHETAIVLLDNGNRIFLLFGFDSYRLIYYRRNMRLISLGELK